MPMIIRSSTRPGQSNHKGRRLPPRLRNMPAFVAGRALIVAGAFSGVELMDIATAFSVAGFAQDRAKPGWTVIAL